jgi:hypothetical protein
MESLALRASIAALVLALVASCSDQVPPPRPTALPPTLALKDLMDWVIDPAADVIWGAAGTIVTEGGEQSLAPTTEEGWAHVRNAAAIVVESGNLLMMPGRARDDGEWRQHAARLIDVGKRTLAAAQAKDTDGVFDTGGELYVVCTECHQKYMLPEPTAPEAPLPN